MNKSDQYRQLVQHRGVLEGIHLRELFARDPGRGELLRVINDGLYFDYSKNLVTGETLRLLRNFAVSRNLKSVIESMFRGERINRTENRAVLHTLLRDMTPSPVNGGGGNRKSEVQHTRSRMRELADQIRRRRWKGFTGRPIRNLVNLGIGGSDLGPRMAVRALAGYQTRDLKIRFVSSLDPTDLSATIEDLSIEETLFVVSSKSFSTLETMENARRARDLLVNRVKSNRAVASHFMAVTANPAAAVQFGIDPSRILKFWDWVGGRFSLTGPTGFPLMVAVGDDHFQDFLKGCHSVDRHFRHAEFEENIPVIMGLLEFWYNNFLGYSSQAVVPYSHRLALLPRYLQQLDMESNGKSVDQQGKEVEYHTGPVIWGAAGPESQHAFFQFLHQGTRPVPLDLIGVITDSQNREQGPSLLLASMLAQGQALAFGRTAAELKEEGAPEVLIPFKKMEGNRPSNIILLPAMDSYNLGKLIALYEHRVLVLGTLWGINSFDQWGVELGKELTGQLMRRSENASLRYPQDSSTLQLLDYIRKKSG